MRRTVSLEKTLMLVRIEGRRRGCQRMKLLDGITGSSLSKHHVGDGQWGLVCCSPWGHKESNTSEQLDWNKLSQGYGFSSSHVWMWELDYKESWVPKNWCFWTVVLEKTLESPLDFKEIQPVRPKGNWSWVFIGRTNVEAETPIVWPPDVKNWLIWKDPDAGKDWRQEKRITED